MTSNEALEKLLDVHNCYSCTAEKGSCKTCDIRLGYEVLEILKKHLKVETDYCGNSEFATHTTINLYWDNQKLPVDSEEGKEHKLVKEWLEK